MSLGVRGGQHLPKVGDQCCAVHGVRSLLRGKCVLLVHVPCGILFHYLGALPPVCRNARCKAIHGAGPAPPTTASHRVLFLLLRLLFR